MVFYLNLLGNVPRASCHFIQALCFESKGITGAAQSVGVFYSSASWYSSMALCMRGSITSAVARVR